MRRKEDGILVRVTLVTADMVVGGRRAGLNDSFKDLRAHGQGTKGAKASGGMQLGAVARALGVAGAV